MTTAAPTQSHAPAQGFTPKLRAALSMIKIAHTIFAMPFALIGWALGTAVVAEAGRIDARLDGLAARALPATARELGFASAPWAWTLLWVVVAMVGARSFAMTFNRIVDRRVDAANPRTAVRELPRGVLSVRFAWWFALAMAALFIFACGMLNQRAVVLAPVALFIIGGYSLTKRWTVLCHLVLGLGLALAPIGGWLAAVGGPLQAALGGPYTPFGFEVFGAASPELAATSLNSIPDYAAFHRVPVLWGAGVMLWVAGFDIIYSLQDERFDRSQGLKSIPAALGARRALWLSRLLHAGACICWLLAILAFNTSGQFVAGTSYTDYDPTRSLGVLSFIGLGVGALCLLYEHSLVKHDDLSRVNAAFFAVNGVVSIAFAALVVLDLFV